MSPRSSPSVVGINGRLIGWSVGRQEDRNALNAIYGLLSVGGLLLAVGAVYFGRKADWGGFGP